MLDTTLESHTIELQEAGKITLPDSVCLSLNWHPGDRLVLIIEPDGQLRISRLQTQIRLLKGVFKDLAPDVSLADELIHDRRQEEKQAS
jgi:bifunctional DNA-binding transcriptional regulator/antitoxin component of YhaV-PrlF toxin-antitoxin module